MKIVLPGLALLTAGALHAQDGTTQQTAQNPVTISGCIEGYYSYFGVFKNISEANADAGWYSWFYAC